jgi:Demerecviridae HNH endonuclease
MQSNVAQERRRQLSLTQERLKELLHYDPGTGRFRWRVQQGNRGPKGEAGTTNPSGYCKIRVDGVTHSAHRLAWLYVYGKQPTSDIDHKKGNPTDNRIANLQDRTRTEHVWCTVARNASATTGAAGDG